MTIGELADLIIKKVNPNATIICEKERIRPEKSEVMHLVCDNRYAKDLAVGADSIHLKTGLSLTIDWMKEHISSYKTGTLHSLGGVHAGNYSGRGKGTKASSLHNSASKTPNADR